MENKDILEPGVLIKPQVSLDDVKIILNDFYGFKIKKIRELNGYDDRNYHIIINTEDIRDNIDRLPCEYVLKIINSFDSKKPLLFEGQNSLLLHLGNNGIRCPKPILNKFGKYFGYKTLPSGDHIVRLLEYIEGTILYQVPPTPNLFYQVGKFVAKLDRTLENFHHSIYGTHKTLWMFQEVPKLQEYLFTITDNSRKQLVEAVIDSFTSRVLSVSDNFDKGIIHGDFNEQNILVQHVDDDKWGIKAVLDFGDSQYNCYLFELAITLSYMILQGKNLDVAGYVLAGYSTVRRVPEKEFQLLKICIAARFCQSLVFGIYFSQQDSNNSYILSTQAQGWTMLEQLWSYPECDLLNHWKSIAQDFKRN